MPHALPVVTLHSTDRPDIRRDFHRKVEPAPDVPTSSTRIPPQPSITLQALHPNHSAHHQGSAHHQDLSHHHTGGYHDISLFPSQFRRLSSRRLLDSPLRRPESRLRRGDSVAAPALAMTTGWWSGRLSGLLLEPPPDARAAACRSHISLDLTQMSSICSCDRRTGVSFCAGLVVCAS